MTGPQTIDRFMKEFEIKLSDLRFHAHHGVMHQETKVGNEFIVDLAVRIPFPETILEDNLDDTVSYADIYEIVESEMGNTKKLIETVAAKIADRISRRWPQIISGHITICKSTPPIPSITGRAEVTLFF